MCETETGQQVDQIRDKYMMMIMITTTNYSSKQKIAQSINQSIDRSINQPTNQPTINQSINQSINQFNNLKVEFLIRLTI
jgi:flagellar basal body P-ring protein FlgI